ncbi:MAG: hypothetical protein ACKO2L_06675 [Planctomycetaceae bacterium]
MITSKLARRALLAATVSATTALHQSPAFSDGPSRSSSANPSGKPTRSASYDPGSVNGELQRLFNENGQEMPSMRSQDLPNARNMQSHLVRPKDTAPPKQNAFQKFFGKLTGRNKTTPAPTSQSPVPPATNEPAPATPAGHSLADGRRISPGPAGRPNASMTQTPRKLAPSPAQSPQQTVETSKPGILGRLIGSHSGSEDSQTPPATPPRPRTQAKPALLPATIPLNAETTAEPFVQPGAAPAFMNSASAAAARAAAATRSAATAVPSDPMDSLDLDDTADVLDLDAVAQQAKDAAAAVAAPLQPPVAAPLPKDILGENTVFTPDSAPDQPAAENPFTGVGLENPANTDAEFTESIASPPQQFDPTLPAISPNAPEPADNTASENSVTAPSEPLQTVDAERMRIADEQAERRRQLERIQARPDLTGFKGFCPVALRDQRQLVDAQPQIQSTFGLHTWTFSSDAARLTFEADPQRYAPAAGGTDVVILSTRQEDVPGKLDYALWFRGRLHLFSSRETMATFLENPQEFAVIEVE